MLNIFIIFFFRILKIFSNLKLKEEDKTKQLQLITKQSLPNLNDDSANNNSLINRRSSLFFTQSKSKKNK